MRESKYQKDLINKLKEMFPGCIITKNDSRFFQGIPDLLILFRDKWAMLEVKAYPDSHKQPNQDYYVGLLDEMSFASFINERNEEQVLNDLQLAFGLAGPARIS